MSAVRTPEYTLKGLSDLAQNLDLLVRTDFRLQPGFRPDREQPREICPNFVRTAEQPKFRRDARKKRIFALAVRLRLVLYSSRVRHSLVELVCVQHLQEWSRNLAAVAISALCDRFSAALVFQQHDNGLIK